MVDINFVSAPCVFDNSITEYPGNWPTTTCWKNTTPHRELTRTGERNDKAESGRRRIICVIRCCVAAHEDPDQRSVRNHHKKTRE